MTDQAVVGPASTASVPVGSVTNFRAGQLGELIVQDCHGRFHEANYRGNLYTFGGQDTALAAVNAVTTAGATAKPIIGVWNPTTSPVNLVILQATICITTVGATAVNPLGFLWVGSVGNGVISTGSTPFNCKTQAQAGSFAKAFHVATALTGITNNLVVLRPAAITCINTAGNATAVPLMQGPVTENTDGGLICIPGGVLGIQAGADVSTHASNVAASLVWEEVPV